MADSIHDQWPQATSEWPAKAALFNQAFTGVNSLYDINSDYAYLAAAICYLGVLLQDSTVMAGDMITHLAQAGQDGARGTIQNFQVINGIVLPQWGYLAAQYANTQIFTAVTAESSAREAADATEAAQRALGDDQTRQLLTAQVNAEGAARVQGDSLLQQQFLTLINAEAAARAAADTMEAQLRATADAQIQQAFSAQIQAVLSYAQTLPSLIDTRAANGYDPTLRARGTLVQKLLDTVVAHEPLVADLVSKLAGLLVDLAGVEDPVLRIAAQLILKQVIDRFGVDTALHQILGDLLGSIIGGGKPSTVTTIMADIGNRLDSLEETAASLAPLAPEADDLHTMGGVIFDVAMLGYLTAAVVDPVSTANDTVDVFAPITGPLLAPLRALLGMPS